jgi:osmotically-inducible protein OsmY
VRSKEAAAGAPTGNTEDTVLKTMVEGKLKADSEVSSAAAKIQVAAKSGEVTLSGSAPSADAVGRAIALALDTSGVTKVTSNLKLDSQNQ